ncbi:hypothetical protein KW782_04330 [Candidatus Parcubacteria bacterium]|nr:hypothetical protein [Candidatus Parcubacteria bacterium]
MILSRESIEKLANAKNKSPIEYITWRLVRAGVCGADSAAVRRMNVLNVEEAVELPEESATQESNTGRQQHTQYP